MSGAGRPQSLPDGSGLAVALVTASWHQELCGNLRAAALAAIEACGARVVADIQVPGALELPVVAAKAARRADVDAVIALGAVIRGGTPHFEYVCAASSQGLMDAALATGVPVTNGVLTCDTLAQAQDRDGRAGSAESKGYDAAVAAIATAVALRSL